MDSDTRRELRRQDALDDLEGSHGPLLSGLGRALVEWSGVDADDERALNEFAQLVAESGIPRLCETLGEAASHRCLPPSPPTLGGAASIGRSPSWAPTIWDAQGKYGSPLLGALAVGRGLIHPTDPRQPRATPHDAYHSVVDLVASSDGLRLTLPEQELLRELLDVPAELKS